MWTVLSERWSGACATMQAIFLDHFPDTFLPPMAILQGLVQKTVIFFSPLEMFDIS